MSMPKVWMEVDWPFDAKVGLVGIEVHKAKDSAGNDCLYVDVDTRSYTDTGEASVDEVLELAGVVSVRLAEQLAVELCISKDSVEHVSISNWHIYIFKIIGFSGVLPGDLLGLSGKETVVPD